MEKKYREVNESDIGETVEISYAEFIHETKSWISACRHKILTKDERGQSFLVTVNGSWALARHARAELPLSYLNLHQASGLKVGDWVKITRAAVSRESGWNALWNNKMDAFIGSIAQITTDLGEHGFKIGGAGEWNYPYFVLEKVTHRPVTEAYKKCTVIWNKFPDNQFTLHCVFAADDLYARAVVQNCDSGKRYSEGFQFAFLDDLSIPLESPPAPATEPVAERPAWLPEEFKEIPAWLPAGYRFIGKGEVIKPGDMVQDENDHHLFHPASDSIGDTVENSWKPREYWITPITEVKPETVAELEPQPIPEPGPERPAWLPDGFRVKARDEVIRPGDAVQANPSTEEPSGRWLFGIAGPLAGQKIYQSRYPSDVWITPITEGQAHG